MKVLILLVFAAFCAAAVAGCATMQKLMSPATTPVVEAGTFIAVGAAIGKDPSTQLAKARQIKAIAEQVLLVDEGGTVPLAALRAIVTQKVAALGLPPADQAAAQILMDTLAMLLQTELSAATSGTATPAASAQLAQVLQYVITACGFYGA